MLLTVRTLSLKQSDMTNNYLFKCTLALWLAALLPSITQAQENPATVDLKKHATETRLKAGSRFQNVKVIKTTSPAKGVKIEVCRDGNGFVFKRLETPLKGSRNVSPYKGRKAVAKAEGQAATLDESFEGFTGDAAWLPSGWSLIKSESKFSDYYYRWFVTPTLSYSPAPSDGNYYTAILYSDAAEQDEWLVTPEITPSGHDILSFYAYYDPQFIFDLNYLDWDTYELTEYVVAATLLVLVDTGDGEWKLLKDIADDYKGMSFSDISDDLTTEMRRLQLDISAYSGKKVRFAFRYVGKDGNSMMVDQVSVAAPEIEASYSEPYGTLYWGMTKDFTVIESYNQLLPVYTPLTWTNTTDTPNATFSWKYMSPETSDWTTGADTDLTVTYTTDYSSEFTTSNNMFYSPVLTASAPGASDGTYTSRAKYFQVGGSAEMTLSDGTRGNFGVVPFCPADGITLVTKEDPGKSGYYPPIFGYSPQASNWWTDYVFQGDAGEGDKAEVTAYMNYIFAPQAPLVVKGLWTSARGQVSADALLKAEIYPLDADGAVAEAPLAAADCKGSDIIVTPSGGENDYLTVPFVFADSVVIGGDETPAYIVKISGFNNGGVTYYGPYQTAQPDPSGMCLGWIELKRTFSGETGTTFVPIANYEGDYGPCYNSFYISLDAFYPWLKAGAEEVLLSGDGESKDVTVDSYYDASKFTFTADTPDGKLPEWLTVSGKGRYGDARLTFTAAPSDDNASRKCTVTAAAPGVSSVFTVEQGTSTGIGQVTTSSGLEVKAVYDVAGKKVSPAEMQPGKVYINKYADGKTEKILK